MKSDKLFLNFLKRGIPAKALVALAVGILLLFALLFATDIGSAPEVQSEESRVAQMCCAIDGVAECHVMLTYSEADRVASVAVVYTGDQSKQTEREIKEMLCSLYGIGSNRIAVLAQKNN